MPPALATGTGYTCTVIGADAAQVESVYVTVNVVAIADEVVTEYASVALVPAPGVNPVVGLQLYVPPAGKPVATRLVL